MIAAKERKDHNAAEPQPLWSARTCPRFGQATCRRRMRKGVQLSRPAGRGPALATSRQSGKSGDKSPHSKFLLAVPRVSSLQCKERGGNGDSLSVLCVLLWLKKLVAHGFSGNTKGVPSCSPGLRRSRCPGLTRRNVSNPVRAAAAAFLRDATLSGLGPFAACTQGRRCRANPGLNDGTPLAFRLQDFSSIS